MNEERVLFVIHLNDEFARKCYEKSHTILSDSFDLYFVKPSEMVEYDPTKMVHIFEPTHVGLEVKMFIGDWYPFLEIKDINKLLQESLQYNPYLVLYCLEKPSVSLIETLEKESGILFRDIYYSPAFDSRYYSESDISKFSDVIPQASAFFEKQMPYLKNQDDSKKDQASA